MAKNQATATLDTEKTREQLLQELTELRARLAAAEKPSVQRGVKNSKQQTAEEALRQAKEQAERTASELDAALEAIAEGLVITAADGRIVRMNRTAERLLGYSKEHHDPSIRKRAEFVMLSAPDGTVPPIKETPLYQALQGKTVERFEMRYRRKEDDRQGWVVGSAAPIQAPDGTVVGAVSTFRDVTEQKELEQALRASDQRYRMLFHSMQEGFTLYEVIRDPEGNPYDLRYLEANEAVCRFSGVAPGGLKGKTLREVFPAVDPTWIERLGRAARSRTPFHIEGYDAETGRWYELTAYCPEEGKLAVLSIDTTQRRQAEEALQRLNETLEQQVAERTAVAEQRARQLQALALQLTEAEERERRRIADLLHDDLQQLLAASRFHLSVVLPSVQGQPTAELMLRQADQLLEQSIAKSRRLSQDLSPALLFHSGLSAAVQWLASQMQERHGLAVQVEYSGSGLLQNDLLQVFLFRCIQELLFNVVKHADADHALVRLERLEDRVEVTVSDQGKGFDPDSLHSRDQLSTGFGVFSILERITYIGGSLDIESVPGRGSVFRLSIPLKLDAPRRLLPLHSAPEVLSSTFRNKEKLGIRYRILLVDDHQVLRQGLIAVLEAQPDIQVIGEASNGQEAVELARSLKPDVVVMDVVMPEMDGIEATRIIKAEMPVVRVIGLSMLGDEEVSEQLIKAGVERYLNKGRAAETLVEAIRGKDVERADG